MIPVKNHPNLFRDPNTGAILNDDSLAYQNYLRLKNAKIEEKEEINKLKEDINDIKKLLHELILNNQKGQE